MRSYQVEALLQRIGQWPAPRSGSSHYKIRCLYPGKHGGGHDRNPSAVVSFDRGMSWFRCYACSTTKPFLAAVMETAIPGSGVASFAASFSATDVDEDQHQAPLRALQATKAPVIRDCGPALRRLIAMNAEYPEALLSFLASKNVREQEARLTDIVLAPAGWSDEMQPMRDGAPGQIYTDCVLIPVHAMVGGQIICVGAQARPLQRGTGPKYFDVWQFPKTHLLYGQPWLPAHPEVVALVEGGLDWNRLKALELPALGCMGTFLHPPQLARLAKIAPKRCMVFTDPDPAGIAARIKTVEKLNEAGIPTCYVVHDKQPKDCPDEEIKELYKKAATTAELEVRL